MDEKDNRKSEGSFPEDEPIMLPQTINPDWVKSLASALDRLSRKGDVTSIQKIITCQVAADIFKRTTRLLQKEPTLLSVSGDPQSLIIDFIVSALSVSTLFFRLCRRTLMPPLLWLVILMDNSMMYCKCEDSYNI